MVKIYRPKVYLAGPDVFLPNAREITEKQKALCEELGFEALHPLDNEIDFAGDPEIVGRELYCRNRGQILACDIIAANCNPFRGPLMDDGTAHELGIGDGLGKVLYGYVENIMQHDVRVELHYPTEYAVSFGKFIDQDGFLVYDEFGRTLNLMSEVGMEENGGRLVEGDLEACLKAIREDLDSGRLQLKVREI
jgi:nucleoside 2-deoxyribosyltransferase